MQGDAGRAVLRFIVRDFDDEVLEQHIALIRETAEEIVGAQPRTTLDVAVAPQYSNMRRHLEPDPEIVERAERALREEGVEPVRTPIRGGTDGAILSAMGLPTPNLFTGGHEYHSVREWASVQDMASAAAVAVRLAGVWAQR
jgi:tripeptide aminopeptidase